MKLSIDLVDPAVAMPGGEVAVRCKGFVYDDQIKSRIRVGDREAGMVSCSEDFLVFRVPEECSRDGLVLQRGEQQTRPYPFHIARKVAGELHPVCNPVFDAEGQLVVTFSGSRGQKVPFSLYRVIPDKVNEPFLSEIVNPSGLAVNRRGELLVSSRLDGAVYRVGPDRQVRKLAENLGIATGIALDREGILYVGDRSGSIFRVDPEGGVSVFATLEPSVAAYHLAFGADGNLYITGPTLSTQDCVYSVGPAGDVKVFFCGLGRPQGLAFDRSGNLYVGASLNGRKGVVKIDPHGTASQFIAGPAVVGLAFDAYGSLWLADTSSVYRAELGIQGLSLN